MPLINFGDQQYESHPEESVLDCLLRHELVVPNSCRSGHCQTCMLRAVEGDPPSSSQKGIKPALIEQNYFLSCTCIPQKDLLVALPNTTAFRLNAIVSEITHLAPHVIRLRLEKPNRLQYSSGQFLTLFHPDGKGRCYSLASLPDVDNILEFHIHKLPGGLVSNWIAEELKPGDTLSISETMGECIYLPGNSNQSILLIATGTGLAPLYGILKNALLDGHAGTISLYHGSNHREGIYLVDELNELARQHHNFNYVPCVSGDEVPTSFIHGRANDIALKQNPNLTDWRIYLCGVPEMVKTTKRAVFLAGASMQAIHSDPFVYNDS